jgi:hypothetical protein
MWIQEIGQVELVVQLWMVVRVFIAIHISRGGRIFTIAINVEHRHEAVLLQEGHALPMNRNERRENRKYLILRLQTIDCISTRRFPHLSVTQRNNRLACNTR